MQQLLQNLNKTQGILGSLIVNKDGIVVASDFCVDVDDNGMGAVASSIVAALEGAIRHIKIGKLKRFVVTGDQGKIAIIEAGPALLLVLLEVEANMGLVNVDISVASADLVEKSKL